MIDKHAGAWLDLPAGHSDHKVKYHVDRTHIRRRLLQRMLMFFGLKPWICLAYKCVCSSTPDFPSRPRVWTAPNYTNILGQKPTLLNIILSFSMSQKNSSTHSANGFHFNLCFCAQNIKSTHVPDLNLTCNGTILEKNSKDVICRP